MPSSPCQQCGHFVTDALTHCPFCGSDVTGVSHLDDEQDILLHQLLQAARRYQEEDDITTALRCAREALAIRHDSSAVHALLGRLYEIQGNASAAQYHFQNALQVETPPEDAAEPILSAHAASHPPRQSQTGVVILLLIACVIFSGLAAVFAVFRPNREPILATLNRPALPSVPRWTWSVPQPAPFAPRQRITEPAPVPTPTVPEQVAIQTEEENPVRPAGLTVPQPASPTVLGPSAHANMTSESGKPSVEAADEAYSRGEYDRAILLYEAMLAQEDPPSPRLYQDLAWCYQQMGNSPKATDHLQKAIQGYRDILETEPENTTAQQGLANCEAALGTLLSSRDNEVVP